MRDKADNTPDNRTAAAVNRPWRVLNMTDAGVDRAAFDPLIPVAQVDHRPPDRVFLLDHIHEYDVYLATLHVRFDRAMAQRGSEGRLRLVYTPTTGLDHLDLDAIDEFGIEMRCIRTEHDLLDQVTSTAELAFTLMLAVARKISSAHNAAMLGHWARDEFRGHQFAGKTLGILGVGRLGRMMIDYGRAFRMNVIGCDPNPLRCVDGLDYVDFDTLAARADVISIHIHLTPQNEHFIDADRIARMKDAVILVNTSRGGVIDEAALLAALESGKVGGFGADVIDGKWRDDLAQHPLIVFAREHDNVTIVPHIGGITHESQFITCQFIAQKTAHLIRQWDTQNTHM